MDYLEFISVFGSVIEYGTHAAASVWGFKPFLDIPSISAAFTKFLHNQNPSCQKGLVRCYTDLVLKMSEEERLSKESIRERREAGLNELTYSEVNDLLLLNIIYKKKFDFPFVLCAKENNKETIRREMLRRLKNTTEEELEVSIKEIGKIASYRIKYLVEPDAKRILCKL